MVRDVDFEDLIDYLETFYHELEALFDDDTITNRIMKSATLIQKDEDFDGYIDYKSPMNHYNP